MRTTTTMFLSFLLSASLFAASQEEALDLYKNRGEDAANALKSSEMYQALAKDEADKIAKGRLLTLAAGSMYYYGSTRDNKDGKVKYHKMGYKLAEQAEDLLHKKFGKPKDGATKKDLALAYYWYASNIGKWGEARGIAESLIKWFDMKKRVDQVRKIDEELEDYDTEDFGGHRIMGRAKMKLPSGFPYFGSNEDSLADLTLAYENTTTDNEDYDLSRNSTTVLYYLEILSIVDDKDTFCDVGTQFAELAKQIDDEEAMSAYNAGKVPETKTDLKSFLNDKKLQEYYKKSKCEE